MARASKKTGAPGKTVKNTAVVTGVTKEVSRMIEYEKISQILEREAESGESFGIGDAMPIYYL
jgi:hypothetical protein